MARSVRVIRHPFKGVPVLPAGTREEMVYSENNRGQNWRNTVKSFVFIIGLVLAMRPEISNAAWSDWMPGNQYQSEYRYQTSRGYYPRKVSAKVFDGVVHYSADFVRTPAGRFVHAAHHGMTDAYFDEYKYVYEERGYELIWHARLRYGGRAFNQGVWVRRR